MHYMITVEKESGRTLKLDRLGDLTESRFRGLLSVLPSLIHADVSHHTGVAIDMYKDKDIFYFLFSTDSGLFSFSSRSRSNVDHSLRYYDSYAEPCLNWFYRISVDIGMPEGEFYEKYKEQAETTAPTS
jgi:hypothetical protein